MIAAPVNGLEASLHNGYNAVLGCWNESEIFLLFGHVEVMKNWLGPNKVKMFGYSKIMVVSEVVVQRGGVQIETHTVQLDLGSGWDLGPHDDVY